MAAAANDNDAPISWKPEVSVSGQWSASGVRFATQAECDRYGRLLLMRWFVPDDHRSVPCDDPVNYRLADDGSIVGVADESGVVAL